MEVLNQLISGEASVAYLLLFFIILLLTKRIVPWTVHQEVLDKLKKYEDAAPGLIEEIDALLDAVNASKEEELLPEELPNVRKTFPVSPKRKTRRKSQ